MDNIYYLEGDNINELTLKLLRDLNIKGVTNSTRAGLVHELYDGEVILRSPQNRHIILLERNNNIYSTIAELFWMFSGQDKISPFLTNFLHRAINYSDDGEVWRGAYGPRIFDTKQISNIISLFKNESTSTRRAVFSIWNPTKDTYDSLNKNYQLNNTKDIPCTLGGVFWVSDNKLYLKVSMRSNDILWGFSHINIFQWTFFQEL